MEPFSPPILTAGGTRGNIGMGVVLARTREAGFRSQGNGDLLPRVVLWIAEVQQFHKRLDGYILQAGVRDQEWQAWRKESEGWRKQTSDNQMLVAETLHAASHILRDLDRRVGTL